MRALRRSAVALFFVASATSALSASRARAAEPVEDLGGDDTPKKKKSELDADDTPPKKPEKKPLERPEDRQKPTDVPTTDELIGGVETVTKKPADDTAHGSQGSSGMGLPILLGGLAGVTVGAISGAIVDNSATAAVGTLVGGGLGLMAGCASGAWLFDSMRDQDTRLPGLFVGLGVGAGLGLSFYEHTNDNGGKIAALAVFPLLGAIAGWNVAAAMQGPLKKSDVAAPPPVVGHLTPIVAPTFDARGVASGLTLGLSGAIF